MKKILLFLILLPFFGYTQLSNPFVINAPQTKWKAGEFDSGAYVSFIALMQQTTSPAALANTTILYRDSAGGYAWRYPNGYIRTFVAFNPLTANRRYGWPDSSGTVALADYTVPISRTITINNTTQDLSANRSFTVAGTITSSNTIKQYLNGYSVFSALNTDSITEGSTNKFYLDSRVQTYGDTRYAQLGAANVFTTSNTIPTIYGSAASGGSLQLFSTSHATKGFIYLSTGFGYDATNVRVGIGTQVPTHTLTIDSTTGTSGQVIYSSSDQTTNYSRLHLFNSSNVYTLASEVGGAGTQRSIILSLTNSNFSGNSILLQNNTQFPKTVALTSAASGIANLTLTGTLSQSSSTGYELSFIPTINQSSAAGYNIIYASVFEQGTGSGAKWLLNLGTNSAANNGGAHTQKFGVDRVGKITLASGSNNSIGTATLSSGTVTVSNTAVTASSLIWIQYMTTSGTLGNHLVQGTIVAGTSFIINSVDTAGAVVTTDNSTVKWWITN